MNLRAEIVRTAYRMFLKRNRKVAVINGKLFVNDRDGIYRCAETPSIYDAWATETKDWYRSYTADRESE